MSILLFVNSSVHHHPKKFKESLNQRTHNVERNIIELLYDIESSLSVCTPQLSDLAYKVIGPPNQDVLVLQQIRVTKSEAQHSSHP